MISIILLVLLGAQLAISQTLPPPERMLTAPQNCAGWPEPRQWIEAQQWWTNDGADINTESQHFHVGGCMPYNQTITGVITIDVLFQIHHHPDHVLNEIFFLAPPTVDPNGVIVNTTLVKIGSTGAGLNFSCPPELSHTCMKVYRIQVDTSLVEQDCVAPLRIRSDVQVKAGVPTNLTAGIGYAYLPELSFKVRFLNGKPACPVPDDPNYIPETPTIGAGYNDFPWSYTRMSINNDALPTKPLSGIWTIRQLQAFDQRTENRVTPVVAPVTRTFVTISPKFHFVDPVTKMTPLGRVQVDVPEMFYQNLQINTSALYDGTYVLFFRSDSYIKPGTTFPDYVPWLPGVEHSFSGGIPHPGGTSSSVLTFSFQTQNSNPAPPPPPGKPPMPPMPPPSPPAMDGTDGMDMSDHNHGRR